MKRSFLICIWIPLLLTLGADGVQAQPGVEPPPADAAVLQALSRPAAGVSRDEIVIVKERVTPRQWKCTAYYTETLRLPWGRVSLGKKVQSVILPRMGLAAVCPVCDRA